jgi:hypothetical protein
LKDGRPKSRREVKSGKRDCTRTPKSLLTYGQFKQLQKKKAGGKAAPAKAKKPKDDEPKEVEAMYIE